MDDERRKAWKRKTFGRNWPDPKSEFPAIPYPENARFSIKQIAYLHAYCGKEPSDIVARYPRTITLAQVHLALAHYFSDRAAIDAEIAADLNWDRRKSLDEASMSLPPVGLASLVEAAKIAK